MCMCINIDRKKPRWRGGAQREGPEWVAGLVRMVGSSPQAASCPLTHSIHAWMVGPADGHCLHSLHTQRWFGFARISYRWKFYRWWKQGRAFIAQQFPSSEMVADSPFLASLGADGVGQKRFTALRKPWLCGHAFHDDKCQLVFWTSECWFLVNFLLNSHISYISVSFFYVCTCTHKKWTISWGAGF